VNESYVMKYFDEMVAAFRQIEERGYCIVHAITYPVYIDVFAQIFEARRWIPRVHKFLFFMQY
jgi:hypothetical protein